MGQKRGIHERIPLSCAIVFVQRYVNRTCLQAMPYLSHTNFLGSLDVVKQVKTVSWVS